MNDVKVEFIGTITTQASSDIDPPTGSVIDLAYLRAITSAHERAGFDRVLVPFAATLPDTFLVTQYAASMSERIGFALAHRAGFLAPTVAARTFATLDHLAPGRIAVHLVTGGSDASQRKDGDYLVKSARYRRTAEYITVLKALWSATEPLSHDGEFYRFEYAWSLLKPFNGQLPVYFGGASPQAQQVAAEHADVVVLWGEPLEGIAEQIAAVRMAAAAHGRQEHIRFALAVRPILGRTDAEAWGRAREILAALAASPQRVVDQPSAGFARLRQAADAAEVHDRALWTAPAKLAGAKGNATALVGCADTVVAALLDYINLGISCFVINGYEPLRDTVDYGRYLIPAVRSAAHH